MISQQAILSFGSILGMLSVILGAFGAHALKKSLGVDQLAVFEVGVRYQMYHALALLVLGTLLSFIDASCIRWGALSMIIGTFLFSFSLYALAIQGWRWMGPITPLGGLFLILGWFLAAIGTWKG